MLSIGGIVGLIGQMPGGAIIDAARCERLVASLAVATIGVCVLAGYAADHLGTNVAFMGLAGVAATGLVMILLVMPETRRSSR